MLNIVRRQRAIAFAVILPMISLLLDVPSFAQDVAKDKMVVSNPDWRVEGDTIVITYDLDAAPGEMYDVQIAFVSANNPASKIIPQAVRGDVGEGKFAGRGRKIWWDYKKDGLKIAEGVEYRIEIVADRASSGSWLYIALGAIAAGGAAALVLLKKSPPAETPVEATLPTPPVRP